MQLPIISTMEAVTPFGTITFPPQLAPQQREAVVRALNWCKDLSEPNSLWTLGKNEVDMGVPLHREVNGRTLSLYPLVAAKLDAAIYVPEIDLHHVPVLVDGHKVCVIGRRGRGHDLHTDLVASLVLFFCEEDPPISMMPRTLIRALYPEQYTLSGHERMRNVLPIAIRQTAIIEAFTASVLAEDEPAAFHIEALPLRDWQVLRDRYPWADHPELALEIAEWVMDGLERPINDHLWVMDIFRTHAPDDYQAVMLPACLRFHYPEIRAQALREYRPEDPETAWAHLEDCLEDEAQDLCIAAHNTLQSYPNLKEQLTKKTIELVAEFNPGPFQRHMVAWLSQEHDVDGLIQEILPTLGPYEMRRFLDQIKTYDSWFENFCKVWLETRFEGLHAGIVKCSGTNMSFNPFNLWLPLMKTGCGSLKVAILANLHRLPDEQAYQLLKLGWTSRWRFVIRRTHAIVEQHYPDYPEKEAMLEHGLRSAEYWTKNRS